MPEITKEKRDELRRLHEAATPAPWDAAGFAGIGPQTFKILGPRPAKPPWPQVVGPPIDCTDATLIAKTRTALPALLDATDEACRFYRADGSHEELPPEEVRRRRIEAAKRLADYERLREGVAQVLREGGHSQATHDKLWQLLNDAGRAYAERCERYREAFDAACDCIDKNPCDPDIFADQFQAWKRFIALREALQEPSHDPQ